MSFIRLQILWLLLSVMFDIGGVFFFEWSSLSGLISPALFFASC